MRGYIEATYGKNVPFTSYPNKLADEICKEYLKSQGGTLLDLCCGRGEFSNGFALNGYNVVALDQEDEICKHFPHIKFVNANIDNSLPFPDETFDVVFIKSVLEHFYHPERVVDEIRRVLKKGGVCIAMVPAWEYNQRGFYDDFTHRTPFTRKSFKLIFEVSGFEEIYVKYFTQLPSLWRWKILVPIAYLTRSAVPEYFSKYSKWVRFSKEIMLISVARK